MTPKPRPVQFVAIAAIVNVLGYMDRVCISVLAPQLRAQLGLSPSQMGWVFGAFSLTYALFQAPWGALADRLGARRIIAGAVLAWSGFTALTAFASNFSSMLAVRLLFGVSEAAITPAIASAFRGVVPEKHRASAFGVFIAGGRIGGLIAPMITSAIMLRYGWRSVFWTFAAAGLLAFLLWWTGTPKSVDRSTSPEQERPSARLNWSAPLVALIIVAFTYTLMWQFFITWVPTYLVQGRGFTVTAAGFYAGLPFAFGLLANWLGAILSDFLSSRAGTAVGRGLFGVCALLLSAGLLYSGLLVQSRSLSALLMALAAGCGDLTLGICWARAVELGGRAAGTASGFMNSSSNLGGFISPIAVGWIFQATGNWRIVITAAALSNVVAAITWLFVFNSRLQPAAVRELTTAADHSPAH